MKRLRQILIVTGILAILAYGGAVVWLMANETRLVFAADRPLGALRPATPFEQLIVPGPAGPRQLAWVMRGAVDSDARPWVLFLHGNGATIASRMNIVHYERLWTLGLNVFAPEYGGFGGVDGTPSETSLDADARTAYDSLRRQYHADPKRIVIYGWSLGSAVAVDLASHVDSAAVILEGALPSVVAIGQQRYPFFPIRLLVRNPFESIRKIDGIRSPLLFLHSREDAIVPIEEGRRLYDAAPMPKQWVEVTGGHVYAAEKDPAFFDYVRRFLVERRVLREQ